MHFTFFGSCAFCHTSPGKHRQRPDTGSRVEPVSQLCCPMTPPGRPAGVTHPLDEFHFMLPGQVQFASVPDPPVALHRMADCAIGTSDTHTSLTHLSPLPQAMKGGSCRPHPHSSPCPAAPSVCMTCMRSCTERLGRGASEGRPRPRLAFQLSGTLRNSPPASPMMYERPPWFSI